MYALETPLNLIQLGNRCDSSVKGYSHKNPFLLGFFANSIHNQAWSLHSFGMAL